MERDGRDGREPHSPAPQDERGDAARYLDLWERHLSLVARQGIPERKDGR